MTHRELDKLRVIRQVLEHTLRWREAARQLRVSARQIARWCVRVRTDGNKGIIPRLRGRASNHPLAAGVLDKALQLVQTHSPECGPTFATEQRRERHHLVRSPSTLRRGMLVHGLWRPRHRQSLHRAWRPRRAGVGELVQLDGSDHAWFEARGPRGVLRLSLDEATSRLLEGAFVDVEDPGTWLRTTQGSLRGAGRPSAFYVDQDSISRVNRHARPSRRNCRIRPP